MPEFPLGLLLGALVLTVTALVSGLIERPSLSFPFLFLGLGFALGCGGLGNMEIGPHDETLEIVATLTLALVLFPNAAQLTYVDLGRVGLSPSSDSARGR